MHLTTSQAGPVDANHHEYVIYVPGSGEKPAHTLEIGLWPCTDVASEATVKRREDEWQHKSEKWTVNG